MPGHRGKTALEDLETRFKSIWNRTDELFQILKPEAVSAQPIPWRLPFIFYVGHMPAFAWNQICRGALGCKSFHPRFDDLFSRGIDPDVDDPGRCHSHPDIPDRWPDVAEILAYRDLVREAILDSVEVLPVDSLHDVVAKKGRVFSMVIEHELMHHETLLYMVQQMPADLMIRPRNLPGYALGKGASALEVEIPAGRATLGASSDSLEFGWDNEFPRQKVDVPAFKIASTPVTNGQFLDFVESGAYGKPQYWEGKDWLWKERSGMRHPIFWFQKDQEWFYQTVFDLLPMSEVPGWPVYVSLAEARAYACWRGKRLPSEAEYQRAAYGTPGGAERSFPWGEEEPGPEHGNFNFRYWSPTPVGSSPRAASAWGIHELVGNGWEWTETPFGPFPGFQPFKQYPEYSADFFDGRHYVLKGASWATTAELLRPSFRNWFQAHYPYVFAKFRCAAGLKEH